MTCLLLYELEDEDYCFTSKCNENKAKQCDGVGWTHLSTFDQSRTTSRQPQRCVVPRTRSEPYSPRPLGARLLQSGGPSQLGVSAANDSTGTSGWLAARGGPSVLARDTSRSPSRTRRSSCKEFTTLKVERKHRPSSSSPTQKSNLSVFIEL